MTISIYIANIPDSASEQDVQNLFSAYGAVESIKLITDSESGKPAGYGFIEMNDEAANQAIRALSDTEFQGQTIQVNQARGRTDR